jgi:hypothetical protein
MELGFEQAPTGPRVGEADRVRLRQERLERVSAAGVELKQLGNQWTALRVRFDAMGGPVVDVADWGH